MTRRIERDITASGVRLRIVEAGSGPAVILIHGLFMSAETWEPLMDDLGRDHHVIAPDLPGFGHSEKPTPNRFPYGIDAFCEAMCDVYAGLGLGRAAVVGHALGGAVAMTLASRHPELVSQLVLVDAMYQPTRFDTLQRLALAPVLGGFLFRQLFNRSAYRAMFRDAFVSKQAHVDLRRADLFYDLLNTPAARGSALATLRATRDTRTISAHTSRISMPTLVVWGREDRLQPASLGLRLAREIPNSGLSLLDAGHAPQEERPAELAEELRRFLQTQ